MLSSRSLKRGTTKVITLPSVPSSKKMRYRMRFVFFPFSLAACGSNSSVAVRKTHHQSEEAESEIKETALTTRIKVEKRSKSKAKTKSYSASWAITGPNIASRVQRLIRGIKCFPRIYVNKKEQVVEKEMEIGLPTDVKHVTHIGLDGLNTNNIVKGLGDDAVDPAKTTPLPIVSLDEYGTAMTAQARAPMAA